MEWFSNWLHDMSGLDWAIMGAVLLVLEVVTGTTYILWPAIAAFLVAICLAFGLPLAWTSQFLLFFVIAAVLLVVGHKYIRPRLNMDEPTDLNDRAKSMMGMRVKAIGAFSTGQGRVQVGDTQWRARCESGDPVNDAELRVIDVKGTTLIVEPYTT